MLTQDNIVRVGTFLWKDSDKFMTQEDFHKIWKSYYPYYFITYLTQGFLGTRPIQNLKVQSSLDWVPTEYQLDTAPC
jgi:hypothetical protein